MLTNKKLELAWDFVINTNRNIFLTGKAGTGKTTFLHRLKNESLKRMVVVAPTGVAAINAKGVTIHSFFQLPFGPIVPRENNRKENPISRRFSGNKINIIKSMDLLVIDEISMVRADVLDGIDQVLRRFRNRKLPFGGVQLLMIGDIQQLPPVIKDDEWQILSHYYDTGYFFGSKAFQESKAISIELTHIFRQESSEFIEVLNEIRSNSLSHSSLTKLNSRYIPNFESTEHDGFITLTTHNARADRINDKELNKISEKTHKYEAIINGDFPEYMFPTHSELEFKVGAQVMFIKNDSSGEKRYFNGKIGKIVRLDSDKIVVRCPEDSSDIITTSDTWENIRYSIDSDTKEIKEESVGQFTQMPLRLAWAITIHKSQGLTFDKIVVDAEDAFAHGQTYVALSRCRTLEGIVLTTPISEKSIINDQEVLAFSKQAEMNQPDEIVLLESQRTYQLSLVNELFDFHSFLNPIERIIHLCYENRGSIMGNLLEKLEGIKEKAIVSLLQVNTKFQGQIQTLTLDKLPESNDSFQERFKKGVVYFEDFSIENIQKLIEEIEFSTDNKALEKEINKQLETLESLLFEKLYCFKELKDGFTALKYIDLRAKASLQEIEKPKPKRRDTPSTTAHPQLFEELRALRMVLADAERVPAFQIFTQKSLYEMCEYLPTTQRELRQISGIGDVRLEKYGDEIIHTIEEYLEANNIQPDKLIEIPKEVDKTPKPRSAEVSYELFRGGKTIQEIAHERELVIGTIESHLCEFIVSGDLKITELMPEAKYQELRNMMKGTDYSSFSELRNRLGDRFSFGDIRMVANALKYEESLQSK